MNEDDQQHAHAREDERARHATAQRVIEREATIRASEHLRMTERRDLVDRADETGFAPDCLI